MAGHVLLSAVIPVASASDVGEARRTAYAMASHAGLSADALGVVGLIATEVATNLAQHARGGQLIIRRLDAPERAGVELLALDKGPGIRDVRRAIVDGYSTAGTAGKGLGAIQRIASEFDLFSVVDSGTALVARVLAPDRSASRALKVGAVAVPHAGETVSGDGWIIIPIPEGRLVVIIDGLGHGSEAARAAAEALRVVAARPAGSPGDLLHAADGPLRATRGAAMAVARIEEATSTVRYAGIGNITGQVVTEGATRSMVSHNGIVGHQIRKVQEFIYPWAPGSRLVMHTDGLSARWRVDAYPGLLQHDPALLAGVLYRDFVRGSDDATIVVT